MEKLSLERRDRELNSCIYCRDGTARVAQNPIAGVLVPQPAPCDPDRNPGCRLRLAASDFRESVHTVP